MEHFQPLAAEAQTEKVRIPEPPNTEPLEEFQAVTGVDGPPLSRGVLLSQGYVREGDLWPRWMPCHIHICWDRTLISRHSFERAPKFWWGKDVNHVNQFWLKFKLYSLLLTF